MIEELSIHDLGVIADAKLPLGPGFTAITGETGAGKTMVVTALGLLMGHRSDAGLVRSGADRARVAGAISTAKPEVAEIVDDAGGDIEDDELLLSRSVSSEGRSRATVGGTRAPVATLSELATHLFCVHGQSEQLRLRSTKEQRDTLDRFGGAEIARALSNYQEAHERRRRLEAEYHEITGDREARRREAEQLRAEVNQIVSVDPQPDEDTELDDQLERLSNLEALRSAAAQANAALADEDGDPLQPDGRTLIGHAQQALAAVVDVDAQLSQVHDAVASLAAQLDDIAVDLTRYMSDLDGEGPAQLAEAQERKSQLDALKRNFGPELADVLAYIASASERLVLLDDDDTRIEQLAGELQRAIEDETRTAATLSDHRHTAATTLAQRVTQELKQLALPDAQFDVDVTDTDCAAHGANDVKFLLRSHPGGAPRPLAKSASGGELSRIMLALEVVVSETDPVPTFVFDEVDAGIGGAAAIEIGRRLKRLSQQAQVIVVTHLAQVAAFANNHLRVVKDSSGSFTESSCQRLAEDERENEMARLLSGLDHSESALQHARELLELGTAA